MSPLEVSRLPPAETDSKEFSDPRLHVEPTAALQWLQAVEVPSSAASATTPAGIRRAFLHRAPQTEVLALYRQACRAAGDAASSVPADRKSTRLNSSHVKISYAVFCLKKKKQQKPKDKVTAHDTM